MASIIAIATLVHTYRGSRHPFPMGMSIAMSTSPWVYAIHVYFLNKQSVYSPYFYYLAYVLLIIPHWMLAHRYYVSSVESVFLIQGVRVPVEISNRHKYLLWVVNGLIVVTSTFEITEFYGKENISLEFFYASCSLIVLSSVMMCVALYRIHKIIGKMFINKIMNFPRMLTGILAFTLYLLVFVIDIIILQGEDNTLADYYYILWLLIAVVGFTS